MFVPTVPAVLLDQLAAARGAGVTFEEAWPEALEAVRAATPSQEASWREALQETRSAWRSAFLRRPAKPRELALAIVAEDPDRVSMRDGECARCHGQIPAERHHSAIYCSVTCKKSATYERARLASAAA
jgi:hypothetical protein